MPLNTNFYFLCLIRDSTIIESTIEPQRDRHDAAPPCLYSDVQLLLPFHIHIEDFWE